MHDVLGRTAVDLCIVPPFRDVLKSLDREYVSYCYFKSRRRIASALTGSSDLDLLIARADQHRAQEAVLESGFKQFSSAPGRDHPSVLSFLAYDEANGNIVHLHMHVRLITGESLLKNFRLPWEEKILARTVRHPLFPVPIPDAASAAVLSAVRGVLEQDPLDLVAVFQGRVLREKFALDREDIAERVEHTSFCTRAEELLDKSTAISLADAIYDDPTPRQLRQLRWRLKQILAPFRTYGTFEARIRGLWRLLLWFAGSINKRLLHVPRLPTRRAPGGGCVVAILGVDGSGKTTLVKALREWLAAEVDVMPVYFGTGDGRPSLLLLPLKLAVPLVTRLFAAKPKGASHGAISDKRPGSFYSICMVIWASVLALEKRIKLLRAYRGAARGFVVLADRYPQDEDPAFNDGPLLGRLRWVPRALGRFEAKNYALARRLHPDLVIKLIATPELIATREPGMSQVLVQPRLDALDRLAFPGADVVRVDATRPLSVVVNKVKDEIWRRL